MFKVKLKKFIKRACPLIFYLFIACIPIQTVKVFKDAKLNGNTWEYGKMMIYGTDILIFLLIIFFTLEIWLLKKKRGQVLENIKKTSFLWFFVVLSFVFIFLAIEKELALYNSIKILEFALLFLFIVSHKISFKRLSFSLFFGVLFEIVFSFWQFFNQYSPAIKLLGMSVYHPYIPGRATILVANRLYLRTYGTMPHPNVLGGYLVIVLFFLLALLFSLFNQKKPNVLARLFLSIIYFLALFNLFITFSRAVLGVFLMGLFVFFFWLYKKKPGFSSFARQIFVMSLLLISLFIFLFSGLFFARFDSSSAQYQSSNIERGEGYNIAIELFEKRGLTGVGAGNFTLAHYKLINDTLDAWVYQPAHNIYLLVLVEHGILASVFFGIFLVRILIRFFKKIKSKLLESEWFVAVGLSLVAVLLISLVDHYFWTLQPGRILFWVVLGLMWRFGIMKK